MTSSPVRRSRGVSGAFSSLLSLALVVQLGLAVGVVSAAPAAAGGGSFTPGGYTFGFDDFSDMEGLKLNGMAAAITQPVVTDGHASLRVLRSQLNEHSSVFWDTPIQIADAAGASSFSQKFEFRINANVNGGADGIVFMIGPSPDIVGGFGGGIGYAGIDHSVGVEFDTWHNGDNADPNDNHVGIDVNGSLQSIATGTPSHALENGQVWTGWVDYDGATHQLEVRASDDGTRPDAALVAATVDIPAAVGTNLGYFGLTSASGAASQTIDVLSWNGTGRFPTVEPVVVAGDDVSVTEGSTVQLTGTTSGPVDQVKWTQVSGTGPRVSMLGASTLTPSFRAVDDGTYVFRLTGTAGTGTSAQSVSDDVTVTVTNVAPTIGAKAAPTVDDGTVLVSASVSDPGILDTHTATVDWGDGSTPTKVAAASQGAGWAVVNAAHVYEASGTYTVSVTVADDDGGTVTTSTQVKAGGSGVPATQVPIPCALCALGTGNGQATATIDMNGQSNWTVNGGVYDNGTFKIQSPSKLTVTPAGAISVAKGSISCTNFQNGTCPPAHTANAATLIDPLAGLVLPDVASLGTAKQWPCTSSTCTVSPGVYKGPFNINSGSVTTFKPGTYVFTNDLLALGGTFRIDPNAAADQGVSLYFTKGSSLEIRDTGALQLRAPSTGAMAGVAVAYDRANSHTLGWRGSRNQLTGTVYAPAAQLRFDTDTAWTSSSRFIAGTVSSQNSTLTIDPSSALNAGSSQGAGTQPPVAASPILVPDLKVTTDATKTVAPGVDAKITTTISNNSARIAIPVLIAVTNHDSTTAAIDTVAATAQTQNSTGTWTPLATGSGESITFTGIGAPVGSTTYPATGDGITGTRIPAGDSAVWAGTAVIEVSATSLSNLLDTTKVTDLRLSLAATSSGKSTVSVQRLPESLLSAIRANQAKITDPSVTLAAAQGNNSINFADLAAGDSHEEKFTLSTQAAPKRSDYASDATYQAALSLLDDSKLIGLASAQGTAQVGTVYAAADPANTAVDLPVLTMDPATISATRPGTDSHWKITVANTGSATATNLHLAVNADGATATVNGLPDSLAAGATAKIDVTLAVPTDRTTTMHPSATLTWADSADNSYGPITADSTQKVVLPASLAVTLQGSLDLSVVHYELSVANTGDDPVAGVTATIPVDNGAEDGAQLVAGSITTTQGQATNGGSTISVQIGDLAAHSTALVGYNVDYTSLTPGLATVTTQAQVSSTNLNSVWSDDPFVAGEADPTIITFPTPPGGQTTTGGTTSAGTAQIAGLTPTDGTSITQPTQVSVGTITPPAATTISSWTLSTYPTGAAPDRGRQIANGTGDPSGHTLGTYDPTLLPNGSYQLRLTVTDNTGATSWTETALVVDGAMKLGRYTTTLTDMTLGVAGIPIQVQRHYDSFDNTVGDFGVGWNLALADFTITTNGALGNGGWSANGCGTGMIFLPICYTTSRPHYVTVTWPDGHNEVFNLTPAQGSTFFPGITTAQFTGRPGTSSTLAATDTDLFFVNGNLEGGSFGADGVYNPTTFVLTDANGTSYRIDRDSGLKTITDANGNTLTFTKNGITSSRGAALAYTRDAAGRVIRIDGPAGSTSYTYDSVGNLATVTATDGAVTSYTYDSNHNLIRTSGTGGQSLGTMEYDPDGRLVAFVDAAGHRTAIEADPASRQEKTTDATGRLLTISSYSNDGNLTREDKVADGQTRTTSWTYDGNAHVLTATDATGTVSVTRDGQGRVLTLTDQQGRSTTFAYDGSGHLSRQVDPTGATTTWTRDGHGNVTSVQTPDGVVTNYTVIKGLIAKVVRGGRTVSNYEYNDSGLVSVVTAATGEVRRLAYDSAGRVTKISSGDGALIREVSYDAKGRISRLTNSIGEARSWKWGSLGQLLTQTDEAGRSTIYSYDDNRRLTTLTDRNNRATTFTYDADGRIVKTSAPDNTSVYTYNGFGELASANNATADLSFSYDTAGRLASEAVTGSQAANYVVAYDYNPDGTIKKRTTPWGSTSVTYDQAGILTKVSDTQAGTFDYTFDTAGRLAKMTRPNGVTMSVGYGTDGYLATLSNTKSASTVSAESVVRDATGRVTSNTDQTGVTSYTFDNLGNLTAVDYPTSAAFADETFAYDKAGNRTSWNNNPAAAVHYDSGGRLTADANYDYMYDGEGNLTTRTERATTRATHFVWNSDHTLKSVTGPDGMATTYGYDSLGRRLTRTTGNSTTSWVYDGAYMIGEYEGIGAGATLARSFTLDPQTGDPLASTAANGTSVYPIVDRLGSAVAVTNAAGEASDRTSYSAFGEAHSDTTVGLSGDYTYTGHAAEGDLIYARARWYDAAAGRFLSEDPVLGGNLYAYVNNDPVNYVDPSGATEFAEYGILSSGDEERAEAVGGAELAGQRGLPAAVEIPLGNVRFGMEHILRRHLYNSITDGAVSKFLQGMGNIEIRNLIREAVASGGQWEVEGSSRVLNVLLSRTIGTDAAGNLTSAIRIVTDASARVITAYPIPWP